MTTRPGYIWSGTEWVAIGQEAAVNPFAYQATPPTSPATGDIWIESDVDVPSIDSAQFLRWRKTMVGGETSLSGNDDASLPLQYTPGYEQLYINGVLQVRGQDYTATDGTTVTGLTALVADDTVEVFSAVARAVADVYTQTQSDTKYALKTDFPAGVWQTWTPTFTGLGGAGTYSTIAKYTRVGKTVFLRLKVTVTSGTPINSGVSFTLPIAMADTQFSEAAIGVCSILDFGSQYYTGQVFGGSTTQAVIYVNNATSTYGLVNGLSATVPMTWTTNDFFSVNMTYEGA